MRGSIIPIFRKLALLTFSIFLAGSSSLLAFTAKERTEHVLVQMRSLYTENLLFQASDMLTSQLVDENIRRVGLFENFQRFREAANRYHSGFGLAFQKVAPGVDYEKTYRWRREYFAYGGWEKCLQQIDKDGHSLRSREMLHNNSEAGRKSIGKIIGDENAMTITSFYQYLRKMGKKKTIDFPPAPKSWDPFLVVAGFDPAEVRGTQAALTKEETKEITRALVDKNYAGLRFHLIAHDVSAAFKKIAQIATGKRVSGSSYSKRVYQYYKRGWPGILQALGYSWQEILAKRLQESNRVIVAQSEWVVNLDRGGNLIGKPSFTAQEIALEAETKNEFYGSLAEYVASLPTERRALTENFLDIFLNYPDIGTKELSERLNKVMEHRVFEQDVLDILTHMRENFQGLGVLGCGGFKI